MVPLVEDFLFRAGKVIEGIYQPTLMEIAAVKLSHVGLNSRITLSGVNWSLHLASEIYLLLLKRVGGYSILDDLPALLVVVSRGERGYFAMSKLVMVIDDSLTVRKIIETSLRREGITSVCYADGIEALRALKEKRHPVPDLVILDIGLPKMDGYEIARHLKAKQQFGNTTIIMLSSRDGVIDRLKGRLVGAKDYITKPFRTQEVMSVVHSHLRVPSYN